MYTQDNNIMEYIHGQHFALSLKQGYNVDMLKCK